MAVLVVVQSSITGCASVSVSYAKRVPGLDGTVSADVLDVSGYGTYQIAMVTVLARRRKQHEQVARAIARLYGDVSAIIGTLPRIRRLELPPGDTGGGQAA